MFDLKLEEDDIHLLNQLENLDETQIQRLETRLITLDDFAQVEIIKEKISGMIENKQDVLVRILKIIKEKNKETFMSIS
jgi:hypothetical protein